MVLEREMVYFVEQETLEFGVDDIENDWLAQLSRYFEFSKLLDHINASQRRRFRNHAQNYTKINQVLYKRNHDGVMLRCVLATKIIEIIKEFHFGTSKGYYSSYTIVGKIIQSKY